jgi:hypothetical protein
MTDSPTVLAERVDDFELAKQDGRWRITLFRFNLKFLDGNLELEADAAAPEPVRV